MIKIESKEKCCGCTSCQSICPHKSISMQVDSEGFLYPMVDENSCINCNLCEKVCPVLNPYKRTIDEPASYACKSLDAELVAKSSSGGIFSMLAGNILEEGGVVFGARFSDDWSVIHDYTETFEGLAAFRGSKYVQSNLGDSFPRVKSFLEEGRKVLFVGTPCQVAGLNHFIRRKYDNLYTFDIVCHSISSPKVWRLYLDEVSKGATITNITFRDKSFGWRSYGLHVQGKNLKGEEFTIDRGKQTENLFMRGFLEDLTVRPSCSHCPARNYVTGSDLMLADCWRLEKYHPDWDDNKGMSQVLILSEKGEKLFENIKDRIFFNKISYCEVEDSGVHAPITRSTSPHPFRQNFFSNLSNDNVKQLLDICLKKGDLRKKYKNRIDKILFVRAIRFTVRYCKKIFCNTTM